ncbi:MAG: exodeoxyribonuclease I [Gammaproteobacteria bacterium]|nr:exodeoxyribonuclease I [Gammaproteobacteria bacterium]
MALTFYWHDYETWGIDPRRDWPSQFAGIRTDAELNVIGKPLVQYCTPSNDMLPHPEACLVTGITPQKALAEGVCEAEFFSAIHRELAQPGTCTVGYNSIRFDDEFTRYGLYRNFFDPYAREWQNGNSRWDIIDIVRLTRALRPEGIEWPVKEDGVTSFRLEELTAANGIEHAEAHDALSDVYATIAMAQLIKEKQPRLFDYLLQLRNKRKVAELLNVTTMAPVLHVSSKYPAKDGCIAMVAPLAKHPVNRNAVIVYDLRTDPTPLLELGADEIRQRVFTARSELPEGTQRIPLKELHINKCPVVVPVGTLTDEAAAEWQIDVGQAERHLEMIRAARLDAKLQQVYSGREFEPITDPDQALYSGGFFSDADRRSMEQVHSTPASDLASLQHSFDDARLPEMLFRYRARNWPDTLSGDEGVRWDSFRNNRLTNAQADAGITLDDYRSRLAQMMVDPDLDERERNILSELADWPDQILDK